MNIEQKSSKETSKGYWYLHYYPTYTTTMLWHSVTYLQWSEAGKPTQMKIFKEIFNPWCLARTGSSQVRGKFVGKFQMLYFIPLETWYDNPQQICQGKESSKVGAYRALDKQLLRHLEDGRLKFVLLSLSPFIMCIDVNEGLHVLIPYENRTKTLKGQSLSV